MTLPGARRAVSLQEAQRIVNEHECATRGHSWDVIEQFGGPPLKIVCGRCGDSYDVQAREVRHG